MLGLLTYKIIVCAQISKPCTLFLVNNLVRSEVKHLNFAITKSVVSIIYRNCAYRQRNNRYETYQMRFKFEGLGLLP